MKERNLGALYGKALDRLVTTERDMLRAIHRWEKARAELIRRERALDKQQTIDVEARQ